VLRAKEQRFELNERRWPLVIARFSPALTDREMEQYLEAHGKLNQRGLPYLLLIDTSATTKAAWADTTATLKAISQWTNDHHEALKRFNMGTACVIPSLLIRSFMKTISWIRPMPAPTATFDSLEPAMAWLKKRAATVKLTLKK
jgi:hypothetical protein